MGSSVGKTCTKGSDAACDPDAILTECCFYVENMGVKPSDLVSSDKPVLANLTIDFAWPTASGEANGKYMCWPLANANLYLK